MFPIREYTVLKFLTWVARCRPEIQSLRELDLEELLALVSVFEGAEQLERAPALFYKWRISLDELLRTDARSSRYGEARLAVNNLEQLRSKDALQRYKWVPLHAVFLFTSEDRVFSDYLRDNWLALDGMSGEYCDIYPSVVQLRESAEDAYALMNEDRGSRRSLIPGISDIMITDLPGMLFWDNDGESAYITFGSSESNDELSGSAIRSLLRQVFFSIRNKPDIASIRSLAVGKGSYRVARTAGEPPLKVVFFAANPLTSSRLALDNEMREIVRKIRAANLPHRVSITQAWAAQPEDLLQYLNQEAPDMVHFSGHGSTQGELILNDPSGVSKPVSAGALKALFAAFSETVQLVLMNACYSRLQGEAIAEEIDYVIGMKKPITDSGATVFASSFYSALAFGRTIEEAFLQGKVALQLEGIDEDVPELIKKRHLE